MQEHAQDRPNTSFGNTLLLGAESGPYLKPTPVALRCWRLGRLSWHLVKGLYIAWLVFPRLDEPQQRKAMRKWSLRLLAILKISVRSNTLTALPSRCMLVSNHISWVDIFVLAAQYPAIFVAKSEIRSWPLVGTLCHRAGTVFIERGRRSSARRTNAVLGAAITRGALISIFPEGTTSDGREVGPFHAALFQPAIDSKAEIQPAVIRYLDTNGHYCGGPNFVGETTFLQSLWHITGERHIVAHLQLLDTLPAIGYERRALAEKVLTLIRNGLTQQTGMAPETGADLPVLPQ